MAGHTGEANEAGPTQGRVFALHARNGFIPKPPKRRVDIIYLCSPNNPTGATATRAQLEAWVAYALANKAIILFDAAYESYISDPRFAFDLRNPGARECAIDSGVSRRTRLHRPAWCLHRCAKTLRADPHGELFCARRAVNVTGMPECT